MVANETSACEQPWSYVPGNVLPTLWRIVYWTSQALTWLVLPMMQSYSMAGDFTTFGKLKSALLENLIYYGSFAVIFILLLIYVAAHHAISMEYLKVVCITASNTWGLILLVVLLGYGLVEIPKSCFDTSKYTRTLSYLYFKVAKLSAEKIEAEEKLEDSLDEIHHAYNSAISNNDRIKSFMAVILEKCPIEWKAKLFTQPESGQRSTRGLNTTEHSYNEATCVRLHQNIINSLQAHHRTQIQFDHLIRKVIDWEDVAKNQANPSRIFKPTLPRHLHSYGTMESIKNVVFNPKVEWYWKCRIRSPFFKCLGAILTCFTFIVVWSEMTFSILSPPLSIFALLINVAKDHDSFFFIEVRRNLSPAASVLTDLLTPFSSFPFVAFLTCVFAPTLPFSGFESSISTIWPRIIKPMNQVSSFVGCKSHHESLGSHPPDEYFHSGYCVV